MKTKPIIIAVCCIAVLTCLFFFVKAKYFRGPGKDEITGFLENFNNGLRGNYPDSLRNYFEAGNNSKAVILLIEVLSGRTGLNGKSSPAFKVSLNTGDARILLSRPDITVVEIPVSFSHDSLATKLSSITFTIHKIGDHQFKIIKMKTDVFLNGYIAYSNSLLSKTVPETDLYSAITLAAFKNADKLKARYDSVVWLDHIDGKTFYYVIKGELNKEFYWYYNRKPDYKPSYQMGLVNADLKEIIPPGYDLIHNVGGTIAGLIEVEKDGKRGFYNLSGKLVLPVNYDQVFPLKDNDNLALIRNGDDYFYLKKDTTVTGKLIDFKIAEVLPKIKTYGDSYMLSDSSSKNVMEYNSRDEFNSIVIPPSYLVDLQILDQFIFFPNPLRKTRFDEDVDEGSRSIQVNFNGTKKEDGNWFESAFYALYNDYVGGRSGLYESKNVLIIDKKKNRVLAYNTAVYFGGAEGGGLESDKCNENSLRAINDSLFEFRTTSEFDQPMMKDSIEEGPYYHYLTVKDGKLQALPNQRVFGCTKYIKLDDSYMLGCFIVGGKAIDHVTPEMLQYMKNEIYASYNYKFKNDAWNQVFQERFSDNDPDKKNASVDDSLTVIDKYNINWIVQKLRALNANKLASN